MMRDEHGIIMQVEVTDYHPYLFVLDGGDSANREGIMALCGSKLDQDLLPLFEKDGELVRHPYQKPWDNPELVSRDLRVTFIAGCWKAGHYEVVKRILKKHPFFAGRDILLPNIFWMHLLACRHWFRYIFCFIGVPFFIAALFFHRVSGHDEDNQIFCEAAVNGPWAILLYRGLTPNWRARLYQYWAGWRGQKDIADSMITYAENITWKHLLPKKYRT